MSTTPKNFMDFTNLPPRDLEKEAKKPPPEDTKTPAPNSARGVEANYSREVLTKQYLSVK